MTTRYKIEDTTIYYQLCEARREGLEREHVPHHPDLTSDRVITMGGHATLVVSSSA